MEQPMKKLNPGATPIYPAAMGGSAECVALLCEKGANVNAETNDGAAPLMAACQEGQLQTTMILSSYGAVRKRAAFRDCKPRHGTWCDDLALRSGNLELVAWLKQSVSYGPLQHIEVLTPERTKALLRSGAHSPVVGARNNSAADLARARPDEPAAPLILRASAPWSPEAHELWGAPHRARAFELLKIGYALRRLHGGALFDAWLAHVMPHAITWDGVPPVAWAACSPDE